MASTANVAQSMNTSTSNGSIQKDGSKPAVKSNTAKMTQKGRKESPSDSNRYDTSSLLHHVSGDNVD